MPWVGGGGNTPGSASYSMSTYINRPDQWEIQRDFERQKALQGSELANQLALTDKNNQQRQREAALGAQTTTYGNQLAADTARRGQDVQFQLGMAPINLREQQFNKLLPMTQQAFADSGRVGGSPQQLPGVTVGGVWSDQQVQNQVNAARSGIAQQTATGQREAATRTAGQGFGPRSPLLAALQTQLAGQGMAAQADAERGIRWDAAEGNAQQRTQSEALRQQQWADYEDSDIRRRQSARDYQVALLSALAPFSG